MDDMQYGLDAHDDSDAASGVPLRQSKRLKSHHANAAALPPPANKRGGKRAASPGKGSRGGRSVAVDDEKTTGEASRSAAASVDTAPASEVEKAPTSNAVEEEPRHDESSATNADVEAQERLCETAVAGLKRRADALNEEAEATMDSLRDLRMVNRAKETALEEKERLLERVHAGQVATKHLLEQQRVDQDGRQSLLNQQHVNLKGFQSLLEQQRVDQDGHESLLNQQHANLKELQSLLEQQQVDLVDGQRRLDRDRAELAAEQRAFYGRQLQQARANAAE